MKNEIKQQYKIWGIIFFIVFLLELITFFLVPYANAEIIVSPYNITETSIAWNWTSESNVSLISINGYVINNFDNKTNNFRWECAPYGCIATINVYSENDYGSNTSSTLPIQENGFNSFWQTIMIYFLFIISIICALITIKLPVVGYAGILFGLVGITTQLHDGSITMTILYLIAIIANGILAYQGGD